MRKLIRVELPSPCQRYLTKKQSEVDSGKEIDALWKQSRKTKKMKLVFQVLATMTGLRERCMYCEDSRGTTIEHFWPKAAYPEKGFLWVNLLLLCQGCQNHKGNRFALDANDDPLLIDPTAEDPWDYLFFDSRTGLITGRYSPSTDRPNPKGEHTSLTSTLPLNIEAITEGRLRTVRNLRRALKAFLELPAESRDTPEARNQLVDAVRDNDCYGLATWFFHREGRTEPPFSELRAKYEAIWENVARLISH